MQEPTRFCYLRISIAGAEAETVVISLHSKECPKTCKNFESICASRAKKGDGQPTYLGTEFHRIVPKFMVQGGDFENSNGSGGYSIYDGGTFDDESFEIKHDKEGVVSMANRGKHTNGSQFFITLAKTPHLDGKHVAFGQVVKGMDTVRRMATVETEETRPVAMQRIIVVDCGMGKGETDSSSSSDQRRREKKSHHKKKSRKRRDDDSSSSSDQHRKRRKRSRSKKHGKSKERRRHHSKERKRRKERRREKSPSR